MMSRQELDAILRTQLEADPEFRARLLADAHGVVGEITGVPIPESVSITVHEETLADVHLVVPPSATALSDEDLALVAGGWSPPPSCGR